MKRFHVQFRIGSSNRKWHLLKVIVVSLFHLFGGFWCFLHGGDGLTIRKWYSFGRHMNKPTSIQEPIQDTLSPTWNCWKAWILIQTEHAVIKVFWIEISTANLAIYNYILSICSLFQSLCPRFFFQHMMQCSSCKNPFQVQTLLDDHVIKTQTMKGSPYAVEFKVGEIPSLRKFCRIHDRCLMSWNMTFLNDLFCFLI